MREFLNIECRLDAPPNQNKDTFNEKGKIVMQPIFIVFFCVEKT